MGLTVRTSLFALRRLVTPSKPLQIPAYHSRFYATEKTSKPLRILFCGSDSLSSACLRLLVKEQEYDPEGIKSINVLVRPAKWTGRGLKHLREVPLKEEAEQLGLTVHERDTFTGWDLPKPDGESINLIVAVSFGLFVPPRILNSVEYGGINVHPSLLPQYRGSAPLHHIIMNGETCTGVTVQTLDPLKFDHGIILKQESFPIPQLNTIKYEGLLDFITPKAANLLGQSIRARIFVNPEENQELELKVAPKIKTIDKYIDWENGVSIETERKYRALGRLWCYTRTWWTGKGKKRTIVEDMEIVPLPSNPGFPKQHLERLYRVFPKSEYFLTRVYEDPTHPGAILIPTTTEGYALRVKHIIVEGQVSGSAMSCMHKLASFTKDPEDEKSMFMSYALTDISEDGKRRELRVQANEYIAKHVDVRSSIPPP